MASTLWRWPSFTLRTLGYASLLYGELYGDWRIVDFDMPSHAAGGKTKGRETQRLGMSY